MLAQEIMLRPGAPATTPLLFRATADTENLCAELLQIADGLDIDTDTMQPCAVMRALVSRVKALNSVVMSYTDGQDLTLDHAYAQVYGRETGARMLAQEMAGAAAPTAGAKDFMAGRNLAMQLVHVGRNLADGQDTRDALDLDSQYRNGAPQNNFALDIVRNVIAQPELAEGFAAVLSSVFGECSGLERNQSGLGELSYEQMMVPTERRDPETSELPSEVARDLLANSAKTTKARQASTRKAAVAKSATV